jgi:hypothetical protein
MRTNNLLKEEIMPAIEITDSKGLIQVTGTGVTSTSAVTVSGETTLNACVAEQPCVPSYSNAIAQASATLTLAYATHCARPVIQSVACVFTLPAIGVVGQTFWIVNGAADGTLMTVSPNASDKFLWDVAGAAGTDDKDIINTAVTAKKGDYVKLSFGSAAGWIIDELGGTWIDQA